MFKLICVTNRQLCADGFIDRIGALYKNGADVILREKDLSEEEYEALAREVKAVCPNVTMHTYTNAAKRLGADRIHLPLHLMNEAARREFQYVGVSVHSAEEAVRARELGADYVTAGHVFVTDCKKGLAPRGLDFLRSVVDAADIPVYAIGGIAPDNIAEVKKAGAAGACIMSGFMTCNDTEEYIENLKERIK